MLISAAVVLTSVVAAVCYTILGENNNDPVESSRAQRAGPANIIDVHRPGRVLVLSRSRGILTILSGLSQCIPFFFQTSTTSTDHLERGCHISEGLEPPAFNPEIFGPDFFLKL
jgi:hypothetical protein